MDEHNSLLGDFQLPESPIVPSAESFFSANKSVVLFVSVVDEDQDSIADVFTNNTCGCKGGPAKTPCTCKLFS